LPNRGRAATSRREGQSVVKLLTDWCTYGSTHLVDPDDIGHASEFCYRWCRLDAFEQEKLLSQVLQKAVFDPEDEWGAIATVAHNLRVNGCQMNFQLDPGKQASHRPRGERTKLRHHAPALFVESQVPATGYDQPLVSLSRLDFESRDTPPVGSDDQSGPENAKVSDVSPGASVPG
jgi:hypothetical protein